MKKFVWVFIPLLVACQKAPVEMSAENPKPLKAEVPVPIQSKPQGVWLQAALAAQVRSSHGIIRCGDRPRLPAALVIDEQSDILVPRLLPARPFLDTQVLKLGRLTPDLRIEKNPTFPQVRLQGDQLELLNSKGMTEAQSVFVRSSESEALRAATQYVSCEADMLKKAIAGTAPANEVEQENLAVLAKIKLAWSAERFAEKPASGINLVSMGVGVWSGKILIQAFRSGNLNLWSILEATVVISAANDVMKGFLNWYDSPFDPSSDEAVGDLIRLEDEEFRREVRKDPKLAELIIKKAQSYSGPSM